MSEGSTRKNVNMKEFARIVKENDSIESIVSASGLKKSTVHTKLNALRNLVGKVNVPSYRTKGKPRTNAAEILAILQGQG